MSDGSALRDVAHVIQLAIAPVFLLTALGTFLSVLSSRLARIVDRARVLHDRLARREEPREPVERELATLRRRRRLVNLAISFGVTAALLVCVLIATAFIAAVAAVHVSVLIAGLFVLALAAFVVALICFLREVLLAVASLDITSR
jgi:hypothetical protein